MTQEQFKDLYDRYWKPLMEYAARITDDPKVSEDVVQNVFMKLWQLPDEKTSEIKDIRKWLAACARNQAFHHIKIADKKRKGVEEHGRSFHGRDSDQEFYRKLFHVFLERISLKKRKIYTLYKIEEVPLVEIAKSMNLSDKRIKNIIYEVTKELRAQFKSYKRERFAFEDLNE